MSCTKLKNVQEMDNFLDRYHIPKLNQDLVNNLNRAITYKEKEVVIKSLPTKKSPGPDRFSAEYYKNFNEEIILQRRDSTYTPLIVTYN